MSVYFHSTGLAGGLIHYPTGFFLRQSQLPPQLVKMLFAQFQQLPLDDRYSNSPAKWLQCPVSQNPLASHLR
jgi:hypothetical protein